MSQTVLRVIRELARCQQAFEALNRAQLKGTGLTLAQFDILATLGNTSGMNFKTLGEKTLITKGTLTGVVDRMERDGLVRRCAGSPDRRVSIVALTEAGEALFETLFPAVVKTTSQVMRTLPAARLRELETGLAQLTAAMNKFAPDAPDAMARFLAAKPLSGSSSRK